MSKITISDVEVDDEFIPAGIELVGVDGNASAIMGAVARGLKRAGNSKQIVDDFYAQAMAGDYDHLLRVAMVFNGDLD